MRINMAYLLLQLGLIISFGIGETLSQPHHEQQHQQAHHQQVQSHQYPIPVDGSGEAIPIPIQTSQEEIIQIPTQQEHHEPQLPLPPPRPPPKLILPPPTTTTTTTTTPRPRPPPPQSLPLIPSFPSETISIQGSGSSVVLSDDEIERLEIERTRNVVRLAATDQLNSEIITNRTRAYLSCESGEMIVKINFSVPFRGVAYANYDRSSNCKFYGDGSQYYEMRIPLKGCGTKQEAPRLFINNIIFRFHRSLELEEDEIKTIICRYPPPLAPPPADPLPPIVEPISPVPLLVPNKLSEIELLLIICTLLFLTLLLLGVGCGYYCLKRRNIKIVRKKRHLTPAPSEITKVSSIIDAIRIPRATAPPSESSETDYPSESPSDDDGRRTIVSETSTLRQDRYRFENAAFLPEPYPLDIERGDSVSSFPVPAIHRPEITVRDMVTTIVDRENLTDEDEYTTRYRAVQTREAPLVRGSIPDDDDWSHSEIIERTPTRAYVAPPVYSTENLDDTYVDRNNDIETIEDTTRNRLAVVPAPKILVKNIDDLYVTNIEETVTTESIFKESANREPVKPGKPLTTTSKSVTTATRNERMGQTEENKSRVTKAARSSPNYQVERTRELLDVYSNQERGSSHFKESDRYKVNQSSSLQVDESTSKFKSSSSGQEGISSTATKATSTTRSTNKSSHEDQKVASNLIESSYQSDRSQHQFDSTTTKRSVILNLLDSPPPVTGTETLTGSDRNKWRTILVTDEIFRNLVIESTTHEEYVRISRDIRYDKLFSASTWQTIVRILTHPSFNRLPLGTEDDFNAEWSETLYRVSPERRAKEATLGSTRSSWTVDYDLRSITEEDVNFSRLHREASSSWSESGYQKTLGHPSHRPSSYIPPPPPLPASTPALKTSVQLLAPSTNVPIKGVTTSSQLSSSSNYLQQARTSSSAFTGSRVEESRSSQSHLGYYTAASSNIRSQQQQQFQSRR